MLHTTSHPLRTRARGFTLIEIMVTVGIILVLATLLLTVGSSVRRNSQITTTRAQLKALEGIAEQFERESNQSLGGLGAAPKSTFYDNVGQGPGGADSNSAIPNFVEILYRYPATKDQLVNLVGDKLHITTTPGTSYILDGFGYPIHFVPVGGNPYSSGGTAATAEYFRSSGPDGSSDWTNPSAVQNADDILSTDAMH
jgi:prepilin-type N-terminal cleavage/methylation domain-containing protein